MKKLISVLLCGMMITSIAGCGSKSSSTASTQATTGVAVISPETVISNELATTTAGTTMSMTSDGVVNDGSARTVTYASDKVGEAEPISIRIEQFSDALPTTQVWNDYESNRILRSDSTMVSGVGEDSYIAYPYICVYDRGCFIKIMAGSGSDEAQRSMLISLATSAVATVEAAIPADAVNSAKGNVIK